MEISHDFKHTLLAMTACLSFHQLRFTICMHTGPDRQNELPLSFSRWQVDCPRTSLKNIDAGKVESQEASG